MSENKGSWDGSGSKCHQVNSVLVDSEDLLVVHVDGSEEDGSESWHEFPVSLAALYKSGVLLVKSIWVGVHCFFDI